ncbi:MAG: hypothetical protein A3C12_01765 [Candidatus Sungbacteria bacterium RIFCSPHIGHO2_02_FULL_49_20]|uniref:Uncharacterized protein n=1 Tax=Candidatus Sungbacteria bacterium RIFCSPHIGHO2_02_FULL_49_20 TaxID=1802272 RepID=A0A1G2KQC4_9BACT|nr:MAG: hypothetical protein A3C12_01765 [Candidatus Sungbacteria bacterium RIFCSPHIGHO2_02_FULL_49_20]
MSFDEKLFHSATLPEQLSLAGVVSEISKYIKEKPGHRYEIIIGSDSAGFEEHPVSIVTALTVRRVGNGGRYFYLKSVPKLYHHLRDRIYAEAMNSITLAQELRGRLRDILGDDIFWQDQIHIDVGEKGLTRSLVDEMVGMVRGFNFTAVVKPGSFGASVVADRHT